MKTEKPTAQEVHEMIHGKQRRWRDEIKCLHLQCPQCGGTGRKKNGLACVHMISCPCPACSPATLCVLLIFITLALTTQAQLVGLQCPSNQYPAHVELTNGLDLVRMPELCRDHTNSFAAASVGTNTLTIPAGWTSAQWTTNGLLLGAEGPLFPNLPQMPTGLAISSTALKWLCHTGTATTVHYAVEVTNALTYLATVLPDEDGYAELPLTNGYPQMFFRLAVTNGL